MPAVGEWPAYLSGREREMEQRKGKSRGGGVGLCEKQRSRGSIYQIHPPSLTSYQIHPPLSLQLAALTINKSHTFIYFFLSSYYWPNLEN